MCIRLRILASSAESVARLNAMDEPIHGRFRQALREAHQAPADADDEAVQEALADMERAHVKAGTTALVQAYADGWFARERAAHEAAWDDRDSDPAPAALSERGPFNLGLLMRTLIGVGMPRGL